MKWQRSTDWIDLFKQIVGAAEKSTVDKDIVQTLLRGVRSQSHVPKAVASRWTQSLILGARSRLPCLQQAFIYTRISHGRPREGLGAR